MKQLSKIIDKIPLAGKLAIRPLVFGLYSSTGIKRNIYFFSLVVLLSIFIPSHLLQMMLGVEAATFTSPLWAKAVSAAFAAINLSVTVTQMYILYRVSLYQFKNRDKNFRGKYKRFSPWEIFTMVSFTLGGQYIFNYQYTLYK